MKFTLMQVSNKLINPSRDNLANRFYDSIWQGKRKDGYVKPEHYWELPRWIAEVAHVIPDRHDVELHIVEDVFAELPKDSNYYLFSVLDVNKCFVEQVIRDNPDKLFICGGYVGGFETEYLNVIWLDSVEDMCERFHWPYSFGTDYRLFHGEHCIPRLTLSTGCQHGCKFCTVPHGVEEKTYDEIVCQIEGFRHLHFELVYVDDKTFGQAKNHGILEHAYDAIKKFNPKFKGFIVQTTARMVDEQSYRTWRDCHIKIVELGVETFNNVLLARYHRPTRTKGIRDAVARLQDFDVKVIANIILGLPGETSDTYARTASFIKHAGLYGVNIYTLAVYDDTDLAREITAEPGDKDELNDDRTFWSEEERSLFDQWSEQFYKIGIRINKA